MQFTSSHIEEASNDEEAAAAGYIHQLAVEHNLLEPDPVSGNSLLIMAMRHGENPQPQRMPSLSLSRTTGEPSIDFDNFSTHFIRAVAQGDPLFSVALFKAIEPGLVQGADSLITEFQLDLNSIRHPVSECRRVCACLL